MTIAVYFLISVGMVIIQGILGTHLAIKGVSPDLCLILACLVGFLAGEYKGLAVGMTVGLFQDLLSPGGIGVNMVLKGLAGVLAGVITHTISTVTGTAILLGMWILSIGCGLASLVIAIPNLDMTAFLHAVTASLLPQSVYNSLLGLGGYWIIRRFYQPESMLESLYRH